MKLEEAAAAVGYHCEASSCHGIASAPIAPSTAFSVDNWPSSVPSIFLGWEIGQKIGTGGAMTNGTPPANPCRAACACTVLYLLCRYPSDSAWP